jgi:hypothetical protein
MPGGRSHAGQAARGPKVILLSLGGIRRTETFEKAGIANIPHLYSDLLPESVFFLRMRNAGVTSHYDAISSMVTGNWQRVDDWGKVRPESPTVFEYLRKELKLSRDSVWFISSNKALTANIGASSVREFGPHYGANVVFPKQLLIDSVVRAAAQGHAAATTSRSGMRPEIVAMLESNNYEGLGWSVGGSGFSLDSRTCKAVERAIRDLVSASTPVTGDDFTYLIGAEVMRRFAPSLLVMTFSDVEVAHFGSYSMHLGGIRTLDRLVWELWTEIQTNSEYRNQTTLLVLPEFGRDVDGSATNGFFNHRFDSDSTRLTWMMCLGPGIRAGSVVERTVYHTDLCPTIANLFGTKLPNISGTILPEIRT